MKSLLAALVLLVPALANAQLPAILKEDRNGKTYREFSIDCRDSQDQPYHFEFAARSLDALGAYLHVQMKLPAMNLFGNPLEPLLWPIGRVQFSSVEEMLAFLDETEAVGYESADGEKQGQSVGTVAFGGFGRFITVSYTSAYANFTRSFIKLHVDKTRGEFVTVQVNLVEDQSVRLQNCAWTEAAAPAK